MSGASFGSQLAHTMHSPQICQLFAYDTHVKSSVHTWMRCIAMNANSDAGLLSKRAELPDDPKKDT
jgi:hypothetical protein